MATPLMRLVHMGIYAYSPHLIGSCVGLQEAGGDVRVAEEFAKAMDEGGPHQWEGVQFMWDNLVVKATAVRKSND
eukprot:9482540-Pyramimonas_sp.AAC.2